MPRVNGLATVDMATIGIVTADTAVVDMVTTDMATTETTLSVIIDTKTYPERLTKHMEYLH